MAKRKRKKPGLKADPKRQAHNSLRGYLYQIWHSVNAWLDLTEDEILYLEGAEDFDKVSDNEATVTQVKATQAPITLRSQDVNDAINHYWELRMSNSDRNVKFRFLTRSKIGEEQGSPFGKKQPGLDLWNNCSGDEAVVTTISDFLLTARKISEEVKDFLNQAEPQEIYEELIEPITWETDSKPASFVKQSIRAALVHHGDRYSIPPADAEKVVDHLLKEALTVATATQEENRKLTREHFLNIFAENTRISLPIQNSAEHQPIHLKIVLDHIKETLIADPADFSFSIQSPVQKTIPPLYRDVTRRENLLTSIQAKLQSEGIVAIHGGAGRGKTTLAKLTANAIGGCWFWQSFTDRDSSQIGQLLQQLAVEVSNQSEQISIVLDDLDAQPQELQKYQEDLGVLVYRTLERGAKLLITSQHEPPNSFIRQLDVSPSIIVHVPDFTKFEIKQFAEQLGCPTDEAKNWAQLVQLHTRGHPRLVHARLAQLREEGWKQPDTIESILHTPLEVVEERETVRQLLTALPDNHQEFLYRLSLMTTEFRKDYAVNIGEIPESVPYAGNIFSQLVGPWIDRVNESYYTISPLLTNAAKQVWSQSKISDLHAQIADAILKTGNLTILEARAVLFQSMLGQNEIGFIAVIYALITASEDNWKELSREFSWLILPQPDIPEKFFPGSDSVNHLFRSLQYRIALEVEPERAPKILEIWDKETKPHEPHQLYLLNRLMLATQALIYYQVSLPAKQMVGYLKEVVDITCNNKDIQEIYNDSMGQLKGNNTNKSNFFSLLFSFIHARRPIYAPFLSNLIDALDDLPAKTRTLLLADFEEDTVDSRLLIDAVWLAEANLENPDWRRCLQVLDKVIEKALAWGYLHLAAESARGKAIIYDECLHDPDAAHKILEDIVAKVGTFPSIQEERAFVYFRQKLYNEALSIYERILPEWIPPSEQLNVGPLEEYRRAALCAAQLNDWDKSATFFEAGAKRTQRIGNTENSIGLYADAGFARFKASDMAESIKLLNLALEEFEMLPQDNENTKRFSLKKRLEETIKRMAQHGSENHSSEPHELPAGFCSDPEPNEKILSLPDAPIGYTWFHLAQVEYRFGHGSTVLEHALEIPDRNTHPVLSFLLTLLKTQHDFRNKTFNELPERIQQLANACDSIQSDNQRVKGIEQQGVNSIPSVNPPNFASVQHITIMLVTALLVRLRENIDAQDMLAIWRANSSELSIKENLIVALDLIESMLSKDLSNALTVMHSQNSRHEDRLAATLKIVHSIQTSPDNLFYAHVLITTALIGNLWEDFVVLDLAELLSAQWLEKIKFLAMLKTPMITVPLIEGACKGSNTGKKKIGQILLAVHQAIALRVPSTTLQQFRSWTETIPEQEPEPKTGQNPIAQRIIKVMENPPHLTYEDGEALRQSIEEGKLPVNYDSPFDPDEPDNQ